MGNWMEGLSHGVQKVHEDVIANARCNPVRIPKEMLPTVSTRLRDRVGNAHRSNLKSLLQ